jgi:hypothetical protein
MYFYVLCKIPAVVTAPDRQFPNLTKTDGSANTLINTGRLLTGINAMITEVILLCHTFFWIERHHLKRTGFVDKNTLRV